MIDVQNLHKYFGELEVLKGIDAHVNKGECVCVIGPSGGGKSTFLRCINLLEMPTKGDIVIEGVSVMQNLRQIDRLRQKVGMVFQQFNLFPHMTVMRNITLAPTKLKKTPQAEANELAMELLNKVGLADKAMEYPSRLSGGQKQRVAIARALIHNRSILLVDEGTSALDRENAELVEQSLLQNPDLTLILISHHLSGERERQFDQVYRMQPCQQAGTR